MRPVVALQIAEMDLLDDHRQEGVCYYRRVEGRYEPVRLDHSKSYLELYREGRMRLRE
jgi:hypothetical protein